MKSIRSIGIIMDGNRRWAKRRGLPAFEGHRAGFETLRRLSKELPRLSATYGLEHVTLYTFSTENWNRSLVEVQYLMKLFELGFQELVESAGNNTCIRIIGQRERFPHKLQALFRDAESKTKNRTGITVAFALSYGGRAEIIDAVNRL